VAVTDEGRTIGVLTPNAIHAALRRSVAESVAEPGAVETEDA
jgi:hypothetical protein